MAIFAIFIQNDGRVNFGAKPERYQYSYTVYRTPENPDEWEDAEGSGGHRHIEVEEDFSHTVINKKVEIDIKGTFRGTIEGGVRSGKGYVRLDVPEDMDQFIQSMLERKNINDEDRKEYGRLIVDQLTRCIKILGEVINNDKKLVLYNSLINILRQQGYMLPEEFTIEEFLKGKVIKNDKSEYVSQKQIDLNGEDPLSGNQALTAEMTDPCYAQVQVTIGLKLGLHVRVAKGVLDLIRNCRSKVFISKVGKEGQKANAQNLGELVKLAVEFGDTIIIEAKGIDAHEVAWKIEELLKDDSLLSNIGSSPIKTIGCCVRTGAKTQGITGWGNFMEALGFKAGGAYPAVNEIYVRVFGVAGTVLFSNFRLIFCRGPP